MKKLLLILFVGFLSVKTFAQFEKGRFLVGTSSESLGFNSTKNSFKYSDNDEEVLLKSTNFNINLNAGYFVVNNLALGLRVPFTYQKVDLSDSFLGGSDVTRTFLYENTTSYSINPFVRYYILPDSRINFFIDGSLGIGKSISKNGEFDIEYTSNQLNYTIGGGLAFVLNRYVSMDLLIDYKKEVFTEAEDNDFKTIDRYFKSAIGFSVFL